MKHPKTRLKNTLLGTVLVALCCFTPILVILFGVVGLSTLVGYLDYVLFPVLSDIRRFGWHDDTVDFDQWHNFVSAARQSRTNVASE